MAQIKCYNTITKEYQIIEVTEEVATFYKRSYWREEMQDRRYQARKLLFDEIYGYSDCQDMPLELSIKMQQQRSIQLAISSLDSRSRLIIYYRYYEQLSLAETGEQLGLSTSYISKLLKSIHTQLYSELREWVDC